MIATLVAALLVAIIVVAVVSRTGGRWGSQSIQYARALRRHDIAERGDPLDPRRPRDLAVWAMCAVVVLGAIAIVVLSR
jgi:hypothetical protein